MKVRYTGKSNNLNIYDNYEVVDANSDEYKVRNDNGHLTWYSKTNFIEVKDKVIVSTPATNSISSDLVNKIEKELKDTEKRMADLRKQLEDAKAPPTNNILLRETRKNPEWMYDVSFENAIANFSDELGEAVPSLAEGIHFGITEKGDAITLDNDYKWALDLFEGRQVLMILDKY